MEQPFGQQLVAGDTWTFTVTLDDFPPALFTLKYFFRGPAKLDAVATANGTSFSITVPGTATGTNPQTGTLPAGQYQWQMCVFDASNNRTELDRGTVEVLADIAAKQSDNEPIEGRDWIKRALDQVRDQIITYSGRIDQEYQINGRMLRCKSLKDLLSLEGYLVSRYRRALIESDQLAPATNQVRAAFGDPSDAILTRLWKNFPGSSA